MPYSQMKPNKTTTTQAKAIKGKKLEYLSLLIVFLLPLVLYLQTLSFGLTGFDDDYLITNNSSFLNNIKNLPQAFTTDAFISKGGTFYRPLQTVSYMFDTHISGENSFWMFHFTNALLIAFIALALFQLLKRLGITQKLAMFASLFYGVHPLFVSSVAWIPARGDLMLSLFSLLSILLLIDYLKSEKTYLVVLHWLSFTLALFCKETAVFLPIIFLLYYFIFKSLTRIEKKAYLLISLYAISGIVWYLLRSKAIGDLSARNEEFGFPIFISNLQAITVSLSQFFVPFDLAPIPAFSVIKLVIGLAIVFLMVFLFIKIKDQCTCRKIFFVVWFLLLLLPTLFYRNPIIDYLDHRFLLPLIGIFIIVIFSIQKKWNENEALFSKIAIAIIILLSIISFTKSRQYQNTFTFYNAAVEKNPNSILARYNRGCNRHNEGDYRGEVEDYSKAIELKPNYISAWISRANAYKNLGIGDSAIFDFTRTIELEPKNILAYFDRANVYTTMQQNNKAINDFEHVISFKPDYVEAYYNIANIYRMQQQGTKAIEFYTQAIRIKPDYADAYINRGGVYGSLGNMVKAIDDFSKGIELNPNDAESYNNRGMAYYMLKDINKACDDFTKAAQLGNVTARNNVEKLCKR